MAENVSSSTEVHVYKPDEQGKNIWKLSWFFFYSIEVIFIGNTVVIEGEKHENLVPTESHHQKEQIIIENPNDPLSSVTHRLEDIHVTVHNEKTVPIEVKTQEKVNEAANVATELKHDAAAAAHTVEEKAKETVHNIQGRLYII
jgi:hypothetical protein